MHLLPDPGMNGTLNQPFARWHVAVRWLARFYPDMPSIRS